MRNHFWTEVGNGTTTSAWYDFWSSLGPLGDFLSPRTITNAGFNLEATVAYIRSNGVWLWPIAWRDLFPVLIQLDNVNIEPHKRDRIMWREGDHVSHMSASSVWNSIRYAEPEIHWCSIVWFPQCIPRHAFFMWLVTRVVRYKLMGVKLKNNARVQRLLEVWEIQRPSYEIDSG
ncbi:uncharacterized protein LOC110919114 [Helianthus annuus]|uniref:uncharacterized protein LOC110919114 n=1 Tax=Helianthus annuus TaxID=4232 RepID=UPI000B8FF570|nr:uncharacterized protein LOC110919114 [Helianthus annuus]